MARVDQLFRSVLELGASDLHLVAGLTPRTRITGLLQHVEGCSKLSRAEIRTLLREIVSEEQWRLFEEQVISTSLIAWRGAAAFAPTTSSRSTAQQLFSDGYPRRY